MTEPLGPHYGDKLEAIEGFLRTQRYNVKHAKAHRIQQDARSIINHCLDLIEYATADLLRPEGVSQAFVAAKVVGEAPHRNRRLDCDGLDRNGFPCMMEAGHEGPCAHGPPIKISSEDGTPLRHYPTHDADAGQWTERRFGDEEPDPYATPSPPMCVCGHVAGLHRDQKPDGFGCEAGAFTDETACRCGLFIDRTWAWKQIMDSRGSRGEAGPYPTDRPALMGSATLYKLLEDGEVYVRDGRLCGRIDADR